MDKEHNLIGDERDRILWYTGCAKWWSDCGSA